MNIQSLAKYFQRFLEYVPTSLDSFDTSRIILLQFALSGLDIIDKLSVLSNEKKLDIIDWIYTLQISGKDGKSCGFRGGFFPNTCANENYMSCHATMTYSCLSCLLILGDDLERVDKKGLLKSLAKLQSSDGCFSAALDCPESDVRFIYSALAACFILNDFSEVDSDLVTGFILKCQNPDGGFGQRPEEESHGGSTYCALASLNLLGKLDICLNSEDRKERLLKWLMYRQREGFHGRPHKSDDSCYTFWIGASLKMLGYQKLVNTTLLLQFLEQTYDNISGGFSKLIQRNEYADPLHSYLAVAGLATLFSNATEKSAKTAPHIPTIKEEVSIESINLVKNLQPLDATLNLTHRVVDSFKLRSLNQYFDDLLSV